MDLDALREALKEYWGEATVDHLGEDEREAWHLVVAAARAVLDSEEAWWCETHKETGLDDYDGCAIGWASYPVGAPADCRVVRRRLLAEEGT